MNEEKKKNPIYLIIGIIIGLALVITLTSIILFNKSYRNNEFIGTWDCKGIGSTAKGENYIYTFKFDNNLKFLYGPYAELDEESFKGTYSVKENDKKDTYTISLKYESVKKNMDIQAVIKKEDNKPILVLTDDDNESIICYLKTNKNPNLK